MPITLAGIPLTPPNNAQAIVDQFYYTHRIEEFEHPGYYGVPNNNLVPIPYPPKRESPRIGCLSWPTGASRWATCHLVCTGQQLAQIRVAQTEAIQNTILVNNTPYSQSLPLVLSDGVNAPVSTNMWLLPPRPIQQRGQGQDWYLLTLVDDRWWWWQSGIGDAIGLQFNFTGDTWLDYLTALLQNVPYNEGANVGLNVANFTIDTINVAYGQPLEDRWGLIDAGPVPPIIDAICKTIGLRLVRNLDGSVHLQNYQTASGFDVANWTNYQNLVLGGGQLAVQDIANSVPESVSVLFAVPGGTGVGDFAEQVFLNNLSISQYGSYAGIVGWQGQVFADAPYVSTNPSMPEIAAAYANQAATDYYLWALSVTDCTMRGLVPRPITGLDSVQEWILAPSGDYVTRVTRTPFGDRNIYGGNPCQQGLAIQNITPGSANISPFTPTATTVYFANPSNPLEQAALYSGSVSVRVQATVNLTDGAQAYPLSAWLQIYDPVIGFWQEIPATQMTFTPQEFQSIPGAATITKTVPAIFYSCPGTVIRIAYGILTGSQTYSNPWSIYSVYSLGIGSEVPGGIAAKVEDNCDCYVMTPSTTTSGPTTTTTTIGPTTTASPMTYCCCTVGGTKNCYSISSAAFTSCSALCADTGGTSVSGPYNTPLACLAACIVSPVTTTAGPTTTTSTPGPTTTTTAGPTTTTTAGPCVSQGFPCQVTCMGGIWVLTSGVCGTCLKCGSNTIGGSCSGSIAPPATCQ